MLCAAAVVAVLVSSCRAPAPEAGRYQWTIASHENGPDTIYVIDTATGEAAGWSGNRWILADDQPNSTPDWKAIREARRERVELIKKEMMKAEKKAEEARVKREALVKSYSQLPLEKQVAWAKDISIYKLSGKRLVGKTSDNMDIYVDDFTHIETLKGPPSNNLKWPYKAAEDGVVVFFNGKADERPLQFGLSRTPMEKNGVFPAPATIIDDVKAEIKRQEEKKK